eukprot:6201088-Pleurochrysis_carterae.AAC.2
MPISPWYASSFNALLLDFTTASRYELRVMAALASMPLRRLAGGRARPFSGTDSSAQPCHALKHAYGINLSLFHEQKGMEGLQAMANPGTLHNSGIRFTKSHAASRCLYVLLKPSRSFEGSQMIIVEHFKCIIDVRPGLDVFKRWCPNARQRAHCTRLEYARVRAALLTE